jgi:RNA-directed DNA polymerase
MEREFPRIPFARYADDVICHCRTEAQAKYLRNAIQQRFAACFLELHPQKTKIAYCCDDKRRGTYPVVQFDFLGYSFRPRQVSIEEVARMVNPSLRGWINYYGTYYRSALYRVMVHFDNYLTRWAATKYKSLKHRFAPAARWLRGVALRQPHLFAHWAEFRTTTG